MDSAANSNTNAHEDDDELRAKLDGIAAKDRSAFGHFYDATCSRVLALALRITQRRELAEEIVCDVYVQVWEQPERYDPQRGAVLAWLMTICRSRSIDALRREKSRAIDAERDAALRASQNDQHDDPHDILEAVDRDSRVYGALTKLEPEQRQIVALAFFRGYTHAEIAEFTNTPLGTVKTKIRRALLTLRGHMAAEDNAA